MPDGCRRMRWKAEILDNLPVSTPARCDSRPFSCDTFNSVDDIAGARSAQGFARKRAVPSLWRRASRNLAIVKPKDGARCVPKMGENDRASRQKSVILSARRVILEKYTANFARLAKQVAAGLDPSGLHQKLPPSFNLDRVPISRDFPGRNYLIFPLFPSY